MKHLCFFIFTLFYCCEIAAQSVYMHEAQEEAAESDGITIWGILPTLILCAITYAIILFVKSVKDSHAHKRELKKKEETQRVLEAKFKCPICGKVDSISHADSQYMQVKDGDRTVFHYVRLCKTCGAEHKEYMRKYYKWSKYEGTALPNSWCNLIYIITGIGILFLIGYHIHIQSMDYFWGRLIIGTIVLFSIQVIICKAFIKIVKPIKPFTTPKKQKIIENNALEM